MNGWRQLPLNLMPAQPKARAFTAKRNGDPAPALKRQAQPRRRDADGDEWLEMAADRLWEKVESLR